MWGDLFLPASIQLTVLWHASNLGRPFFETDKGDAAKYNDFQYFILFFIKTNSYCCFITFGISGGSSLLGIDATDATDDATDATDCLGVGAIFCEVCLLFGRWRHHTAISSRSF
jgi:hypothetical protein